MTSAGTPRFPSHPAKRLTLLVSARDHTRHGSLAVELLQRARRAKVAGATVFEGREGFGASGRVHRTRLLSDDAPVTVVVVDTPGRIESYLDEVTDLLEDVFVTVDDVDVVEL